MTGRELVAALCGQDNVVVIRRPFVAWLGHVSDALLLDQAMYWQDRAGDGEWWHQSDDDMSERIFVPVRSLKRSRERLIAAGLMETVRKGIPARIYYRVNLQAAMDGLAASLPARSPMAGQPTLVGPASDASRPDQLGQNAEPSIDEGGVKGVRKVKALTPNPHGTGAPSTSTPPTPTVQAGNPGDQVAQRTVPTRGSGNATPSRAQRSTTPDRAATPKGGSDAPGGKWHPVAAAIMAALGRPVPRGKTPDWLGKAIAAFGDVAGDDPDRAAELVEAWSKSKALRESLERSFFRDRDLPALVGGWIATSGRTLPAAKPPATMDREGVRMARLGAPDNWREIVYTHDGTRRSPVLALPRMGLEPYAKQGTWPAWYRAFEGVGS